MALMSALEAGLGMSRDMGRGQATAPFVSPEVGCKEQLGFLDQSIMYPLINVAMVIQYNTCISNCI